MSYLLVIAIVGVGLGCGLVLSSLACRLLRRRNPRDRAPEDTTPC